MADYLFKDRVKDTTTTTGTGNITLSGSAPSGYQSFNSAFSTGTNFHYCIEGGTEWEVGVGTLSASTTLVRSTVLASSNSGSAVSFSSGTKNVFATVPASLVNSMQAVEAETDSGTSVTLDSTDKGKDKRYSSASAKTVTVDNTTNLGTDFICVITNTGAGVLTLSPGAGVTLRDNIWKLNQYERAVIVAIGSNEYIVYFTRFENIITLTDGANISTDCSLGRRFRVTLAGNRTLDNPTNMVDGFQYTWEFIQDATGSRTISLGGKFAFGVTIPSLTLTVTASKRDFLTAQYDLAADKFYVIGLAQGY